jgi:2-phosphosulfolactate phosphatase
MPLLRVLCTKESLEPHRLEGQVVVVVDVLFCTSTIVHAFHQGVMGVWPALDREEANLLASGIRRCIRAGEYLAEQLPGFASATPLLLGRECLRGNTLVYCTTNGSVALRRAAAAPFVYAGALLNGAWLAEYIVRHHPEVPVLIVCSGSAGHFNLEDFYGAGHIVTRLTEFSAYELNDAAIAAMLLYRGREAYETLIESRVGRLMRDRSLEHEVHYAAQRDRLQVIPRLQNGQLVRIWDR